MSQQYVGRHVRARVAVGFLPVAGQPFNLDGFVEQLARAVVDRFGGDALACSELGNPIVELWATNDRSTCWVLCDVWLSMAEPTAVPVAGIVGSVANALQAAGGAQRQARTEAGGTTMSSAAVVFSDAADVAVIGADTASGVTALPWPVTFGDDWTRLGVVGAASRPDCRVPDRTAPPSPSGTPPGFRQVGAAPLGSQRPPLQDGLGDVIAKPAVTVGRIIVYGVAGTAVLGAGAVLLYLALRKPTPEPPMGQRQNPTEPTRRDVTALRAAAGRGDIDATSIDGIDAALVVAWAREDAALADASRAWARHARLRKLTVPTGPDDPAYRFDVLKVAMDDAWSHAKSDAVRSSLRRIADRYSVTITADYRAETGGRRGVTA